MSRFALDGAVAVVTGAAGGIGRAIVFGLEAEGVRVVGVDIGEAADAGNCQHCDVTDGEQVRGLVDRVVDEYGGIDLLVHAAGVTRDGVLWKLEDEDWSAVMRVNLDAAFLLLRASARHLRRSSRGATVLVSSINGERGKIGQANYAASKAGLIGLARSAARELGRDGVRVNVIAPGFITTPMSASLPSEIKERAVAETVLGRTGRPEDIADAVVFLCSGLSGHVTGQVLRVDGGQLMA